MNDRHLINRDAASIRDTLFIPRHQRTLLILRQPKIGHATNRIGFVGVARIGVLVEVIHVIQEF